MCFIAWVDPPTFSFSPARSLPLGAVAVARRSRRRYLRRRAGAPSAGLVMVLYIAQDIPCVDSGLSLPAQAAVTPD